MPSYSTVQKAIEALPSLRRSRDAQVLLEMGALDQFGPTCGFYALYLVLDYWHRIGKSAKPLPPRFRHATHQLRAPEKNKSLRAIGKKLKVTTQGTVLSTENLGKVAREAGNFDYKNIHTDSKQAFLEQCIAYLERGYPIIVGIDIDYKSEHLAGTPFVRSKPATRDSPNEGGHWAVIFGVQQYLDSAPLFLASHWGEYWIWEGETLYKSNHGLAYYPEELFVKKKMLGENRTDVDVTLGGTTYRPGQRYYFRDFDLVHGDVDIEEAWPIRIVPMTAIDGMRGKLLIVHPRAEQEATPSSPGSNSEGRRRQRIEIQYDPE